MKKVGILLLGMVALGLSSCDKHDFIDDLTITGEVGPQAYWEVASALMTAGSEMNFDAQYYTSLKDVSIDRSEVWYNLTESLEKTVTCPWVSTFSFTVTSVTSEEKRVAQKIAEFKHEDVAQWSDSLHAYFFSGSFPVSSTLAPFAWNNPVEFDSTKMDAYFGEGFMQHFKDSLYTMMQFEDFRKMYLGLGLREDFKEFTDSTFDVNSNAYKYHFPWNADSTATPIPAKIAELYADSIGFAQLIENSAENNYAVSYKRSYQIRALLRVYDDREVYGTTVAKEILIN